MEILILILLVILLFIDGFTLFKLFYKQEKPTTKQTKPKLTREEKEKQEQLRKSFDNLMNYDENAARKSRK